VSVLLASLEEASTLTSTSEAAAGFVMLVGGLALVPIAVLLARRIHPGRNVHFARWGFTHALVVLALFVGLSFPWMGAPEQPVAEEPAGGVPPLVLGFVLQVFVWLLLSAAIVASAVRVSPEGWRALGFHRGQGARAVLAGLVAFALCLPAILGCELLWPWLLERAGASIAPQEVAVRIAELDPRWWWIAVPAGTLVLPFFEELMFRGFLQPLFVQNFGDKGGVVVTSVLFAAVHGELTAFLPLFAISLVLGGIMLRTQRLVACWLAHAFSNGIAMSLLLLPETRELLLGG